MALNACLNKALCLIRGGQGPVNDDTFKRLVLELLYQGFVEETDASTPHTYLATASVNSVVFSAMPVILAQVDATTIEAVAVYLKLYDQATPPSTTDIPKYEYLIPGRTTGAGTNPPLAKNLQFNTGLAIRITKGSAAYNDNTPVLADATIVNYALKTP